MARHNTCTWVKNYPCPVIIVSFLNHRPINLHFSGMCCSESWSLWNYPDRSTYHEIIQVNRASDSNYVTVRPRLSQLSGYISKFSSGLMALLKFRRETRSVPPPYPLSLSCLPANRWESRQLIHLSGSHDFIRETGWNR